MSPNLGLAVAERRSFPMTDSVNPKRAPLLSEPFHFGHPLRTDEYTARPHRTTATSLRTIHFRNWSRGGLALETHLTTLSGMDRMPQPQETFFEETAPHVRAYLEQLQVTIADLHTRITELESNQTKNSTNSSLPPSSEHPHAKPAGPTPKSLRGCGVQPGHAKQQPPLLPTEQCQRVIPCVAPTCRRCAAILSGTDPQPLQFQFWELPEIKPSVSEYQRHRLTCRCGTVTCGALSAVVPTGRAGPHAKTQRESWLTEAVEARFAGNAAPSLLSGV